MSTNHYHDNMEIMKTLFCFATLMMSVLRAKGTLQERYLGCYRNAATMGSSDHIVSSTSMTLDLCLTKCKNYGETYAIFQNGSVCGCVENVSVSTSEDKCNVPCSGNRSQICGGQTNEYSVYAVCQFGYYGVECNSTCHCMNRAPCDRLSGKCPNGCDEHFSGDTCNGRNAAQQYIGCFIDQETRDISITAYCDQAGADNSMEKCLSACSDKTLTSTFFAMQNADQCFCGDTFGAYGEAPDSDCFLKCKGNSSQRCGGYWRNSIYSVCPNGTFGSNCGDRCHCEYGNGCYFTNGSCVKNGSCEIGWMGASCNIRDCNHANGGCEMNETCAVVNLNFTSVTRCLCPTGYYRNFVWDSCDQDVDECRNSSPCNITEKCVNTIGSFECTAVPPEDTATKLIPTSMADNRTSVIIGAVVGSIAGMLLALVVLVLAILCFRRKKSSQSERQKVPDEQSEESTPGLIPIYQNGNVVQESRIKTTDLERYVERKKLEGGFKNEFRLIPTETTSPCEYGKRKEFKKSNRFKNIIPYEYNQIKLENGMNNGYINASSITGFHKEKMIATQGPNKATLNDFWAMVYEQNVGVIVMITNLVENDKDKCTKYWPDSGTCTYGDINVALIDLETWNNYTLRKLEIWKDESKRYDVVQWHFTTFPDHGVTSDVRSFLVFRRRVRQSMSADRCMVVHCSAGVGRTGTFMAIDYLIDEAKVEGHVDVPGCVRRLREQRPTMVQTLVQYEFIYTALVTEFTLGNTSIPCNEFETTLNQLLVMDSSGISKLQKEFRVLEKESDRANHEYQALGVVKSKDTNNTWNCCHVPISNKRHYQVSIIPDESELQIFWKFVIDQNCKIVVFLDDAKNRPRNYFPEKNQAVKLDNATIKFLFETTEDFGTSMKLSVERTTAIQGQANAIYANSPVDIFEVSVLHVTSVKTDAIEYEAFQELYTAVKKLHETIYNLEANINETVLCRTGCYQSGFYIAATNALEELERHKEIDIFNIVRELKKFQPKFIPTLTSYNDLYVTVGRHLRNRQY